MAVMISKKGLYVLEKVLIPTYNISASLNPVNEGSSVSFTFTTNAFDTTYYWRNGGDSNAADFIDGANSGSFATVNGSATITRTLRNDLLTEGPETLIFEVRSQSFSGSILTTSPVVGINDTSLTVYNLNSSVVSVNEGSSVVYTFTTSGPDGTYYWKNSGTTTSADFSDGVMSGSFVVTAGTGSVSRTLTTDNLTEGNETIVFEVRANSVTGSILSSVLVNVNDTSLTPWSPSQLSNLVGWYKADTGVSLSGTSVTAWSDQSGKGNTLTPLTSNPTYVSNGNPLGGAAIQFNGTNLVNLNASLTGLGDNLTLIHIGKVTTAKFNAGLLLVNMFGGFVDGNVRVLDIRASNVSPWTTWRSWFMVGGWGAEGAGGSAMTDGVRITKVNSSGLKTYQNGTLVGTYNGSLGSLSPSLTRRIYVGGNPYTTEGAFMRTYEVIITTADLSATDISNIQTYAQTKWGV